MLNIKQNDKQKRLNQSFSQQKYQNKQINKVSTHKLRQIKSHEEKNINQEEKQMKQKASLNKLLNTNIHDHNKKNIEMNKNYQWEIVLIDQKRTITGIKVKLKCNQIKSLIFIVIRISFTLQYFRQGKVGEGNIFIEIDQLNFQLSKTEIRSFQLLIQKNLKPFLNSIIYVGQQQDSTWVKELFHSVQQIITSNSYEKRNKKVSESLNRKQILTNYMLYHPPVSFTWSPRGTFCLTENKIPEHKNSFIGNPLSFKLHIEVPKVSHLNTVNQEQLASNQQQQNQNLFFNWDVKQEVDFFSFSKHKRQLYPFYKDNLTKQVQNKKKSSNQNLSTIKTDSIILQYASKLTPTLRKIYQRYFNLKPDYSQLNRGQKLNIFTVLSQSKRYQDDMLYLMQKLSLQKYNNVIQVVMQNIMTGYTSLINMSSNIDNLKYFVLNQFIKQEKIKSGIALNSNLALLLKAMIVENQYYSQQLQRYFKKCYLMIGLKPSSKIYYLGSYIHFDEIKSQNVLIQLIQKYLNVIVKDKTNKYQEKIQLKLNTLQRVKKSIKIKKIIKFPPISQQWLITDEQRKKLIQIILPILLVRDRNYQDFYYTQIQRMLVTNTKMINFYKNLILTIKKIEEQRYDFLQNIVNKYKEYQQQKKLTHLQLNVRRQFTIYCKKCQRANRTYQISQAQNLQICNKCKK